MFSIIERSFLIDGQATEDQEEHPANVVVKLIGCSFKKLDYSDGSNGYNIHMYEVSSVSIRDCRFTGNKMEISGRSRDISRCCSNVMIKKSKFRNSNVQCTRTSVNIVASQFTVTNMAAMVTWTGYHGSRFTAVDTTFIVTKGDEPRALLSVTRKNVAMENVQLLCPLKVTADLSDEEKYQLLCTTLCVHNEYKVEYLESGTFKMVVFFFQNMEFFEVVLSQISDKISFI